MKQTTLTHDRLPMRKTILWGLAGMPFGALAGGFCGLLAGSFLARASAVIDQATGTPHPDESWYVVGIAFGAVVGAFYFAYLWGRDHGRMGNRTAE